MPLNGGGTASRVPGTSAAPNTTIKSADYESSMDDIYGIFNTARPVQYGGTGNTVGSDRKMVYSAKSANYTAVADDNNAVLRFTAVATLSLTAAATLASGWHCWVFADGGAVTIDPNGSEQIDGATTLAIPDGYSAFIVCNGSAFFTDKASQRPGTPLQRSFTSNSSVSSITTVIPIDNTVPQVTEGDEVLSITMTPTSATTRFRARACVIGSLDDAENWAAALFTDASSSAIDTKYATCPASGFIDQINLEWEWVPGVTTPVKVSVRAGPAAARTLTINAGLFGGTIHCTLCLEEIIP